MAKLKRVLTVLMLTALLVLDARNVYAEAGTIYSCRLNRVYRHPVTGDIEDSGGEASEEIGQGMVEGAVEDYGMLEVTDSGAYYLTIRMNLMDFTKRHTFWVQRWGGSGWTKAKAAISQRGSNDNGETADIVIAVPGERCVVRGGMYVEAMGRDVVWYMYPDDFEEGNQYGMKAVAVTGSSGDREEAARERKTKQDAAPTAPAPTERTKETPQETSQTAEQEAIGQESGADPAQSALVREAETEAVWETDPAGEGKTPVRPAASVGKGSKKEKREDEQGRAKESAAPAVLSESAESDVGAGAFRGLTLSTADEKAEGGSPHKRGADAQKAEASVFWQVFGGVTAGIVAGGLSLFLFKAGFGCLRKKGSEGCRGEEIDG